MGGPSWQRPPVAYSSLEWVVGRGVAAHLDPAREGEAMLWLLTPVIPPRGSHPWLVSLSWERGVNGAEGSAVRLKFRDLDSY